MDSKQKNIKKLYKARTDHLKWLSNIKFILSGVKNDKKLPKPVLHESDLGKWFYENALQFSQFKSQIVLDEMEELLEKMYEVYTNLYSVYQNVKGSTFQSFFGVEKRLNQHESKLVSEYYEEIVIISDKFKNKLKALERQIMALDETKHTLIQNFDISKEDTNKTKSTHSVKEYNYGPRG